MKIVFVGGGTGGHFYPLVAVANEVGVYAQNNQLVQPKKYYFGPTKYDEKALYKYSMKYVNCPAGKLRLTKDIASRIKNFFSFIAMFLGIMKALINLLFIFPDVVFSKGGYASFPVLFAARILRIPVVIHESDATFGRVNKWSTSFATHIAISYPEAEEYLNEKERAKTALVGNPVRAGLMYNPNKDAYSLLRLDKDIKTILVIGGSAGAAHINDNLFDALPDLLKKYQIIHQTGRDNFDRIKLEAKSLLSNIENKKTYLPIDFLSAYNMRLAYSVADVVITRAGSGALFEIAEWGIPSIVIPIPESISRDQRKNAYAYARSAGGIVIEQQNLSPNLLLSQIDRLLENENELSALSEKAKSFAKPDAAKKIAEILVRILKTHET